MTSPVFTKEGAAYCPIERKRRGPVAVAAYMSVLLVGAGFLSFSVFSPSAPITTQTAHLSIADDPTINRDQDVNFKPAQDKPAQDIADAKPALVVPSESVASLPVKANSNASIEQALHESRAARAITAEALETTIAAEPDVNTGLMPRLKPTLLAKIKSNNPTKDATAPQIKTAVLASISAKHVPALQPMRLGSMILASDIDAPPSVFFASDVTRITNARAPVALAFAQDVSRDISEARIRITKGENFVDALKRAGVGAADRNEAAYAFGKHYNLRRLRPGQEFKLTLGWPNQTLFQLASSEKMPKASLLGLEFRADAENRILMRREQSGKLEATKAPITLTTRTMSVAGRITGSLYLSAKSEGTPDGVIADLANAFSYDVDFQREIRGGDQFEAIFDVHYDDRGELVSSGDILFARLTWRGGAKEKGYYRFASKADGERPDYYDAAGQSAKRLLMKTPIDGARLSSGFGSRKHPILGYRRAHKGVDFAARRGTPIKAAGDGVIERANRYGSFGNYVLIRHSNGYKTAYAHLKGFARGIRKGKRVDQGDIIAYVGTTGRSTGPHLHYEVHLKGKAVNPQRLKIAATGKNLSGADLTRFKAQRDLINAMRVPQTDEHDKLAKNDDAEKSAL